MMRDAIPYCGMFVRTHSTFCRSKLEGSKEQLTTQMRCSQTRVRPYPPTTDARLVRDVFDYSGCQVLGSP